jgi:hypothetical protein
VQVRTGNGRWNDSRTSSARLEDRLEHGLTVVAALDGGLVAGHTDT